MIGGGALHYVLPVDGVSVAQELVVVHIHAAMEDLCGVRHTTQMKPEVPQSLATYNTTTRSLSETHRRRHIYCIITAML